MNKIQINQIRRRIKLIKFGLFAHHTSLKAYMYCKLGMQFVTVGFSLSNI